MSLLLIIYIIGWVSVGYLFARNVYRPGGIDGKGRERRRGEIPERHVGWALMLWLTYGAIWPLMVTLLAGAYAIDFAPDAGRAIHRVADKLFGVKP